MGNGTFTKETKDKVGSVSTVKALMSSLFISFESNEEYEDVILSKIPVYNSVVSIAWFSMTKSSNKSSSSSKRLIAGKRNNF